MKIRLSFFALLSAVLLLGASCEVQPQAQTNQVVDGQPKIEEQHEQVQTTQNNDITTNEVKNEPQPDSKVVELQQPVSNTNNTQDETPTQKELYVVTQVVDGDTFKVSIGGKTETLRMIGIDTPETVDPRKSVQCFGLEASNKAKSLLIGKKVRLEADSSQGERDKYGRLLRYAYLEDGTFFNKLMISDGYAHEYTYNTPYQYQSEFKQAETDARNNKRGLWADDACPQAPVIVTPVPVPTTTTPPPTTIPSSDHTYYTSSYYSSKYYYCDTDDGWKSLSPKYLKSFPSVQKLLSAYPSRILHEPCK
jgi:micrococcal nuclease